MPKSKKPADEKSEKPALLALLNNLKFTLRRRCVIIYPEKEFAARSPANRFPFVILSLPWTFLAPGGKAAPIRVAASARDVVLDEGLPTARWHKMDAVEEIPPAGFNLSEEHLREMVRTYVSDERRTFTMPVKNPETGEVTREERFASKSKAKGFVREWLESGATVNVASLAAVFPGQYTNDDLVTPRAHLDRAMALYDRAVSLGGYPRYRDPEAFGTKFMPNPLTGDPVKIRERVREDLARSLVATRGRAVRFDDLAVIPPEGFNPFLNR